MAFSAEAVSRARQRLASMKADRESENNARLMEAYEKVPRIKQIDLLLRRTMLSAAQAIFASGGDGQNIMEQARQENLALQRERAALCADHFPQGYLDAKPVCERCGGSGYLGSTMCACLEELCRQEQQKELGNIGEGHERFDGFDLSYYSDQVISQLKTSPRGLMERNLKLCREYAARFTADSGNLLFIGGTGLGKSYLAVCIAREAAYRGYDVVYENAISLFNKLERAKFTPTEEARREAERIEKAELLIVDDLGTEMPGQFVTAALYGLLNTRLQERRPMVITTNLNVEEAAKRYSPQIASRLYGDFSRLVFVGTDIRVQKNRGTV